LNGIRILKLKHSINKGKQTLSENAQSSPKLSIFFKILLPSVCYLLSSLLLSVALLWISVSVNQMLSSSVIIFTALLTVFYRKRKLKWFGFLF
jgi:drug/metabolite transporter (DMT)-like permease